jgi:hypothetical protein
MVKVVLNRHGKGLVDIAMSPLHRAARHEAMP